VSFLLGLVVLGESCCTEPDLARGLATTRKVAPSIPVQLSSTMLYSAQNTVLDACSHHSPENGV
jgi:hypothetical protein